MSSAIRSFLLPPADLPRLLEAGGPLADLEIDPARLGQMSVAVVEVDGQIVAYWVGWLAFHVEPLYVMPAYRKSPAVIKHVVEGMHQLVADSGEPAAYCQIDDGETAAQLASYADRLGFLPAPGRLYYLVVQPAAPVKE